MANDDSDSEAQADSTKQVDREKLNQALNQTIDSREVLKRVNAQVADEVHAEGTAKVDLGAVERYLEAARSGEFPAAPVAPKPAEPEVLDVELEPVEQPPSAQVVSKPKGPVAGSPPPRPKVPAPSKPPAATTVPQRPPPSATAIERAPHDRGAHEGRSPASDAQGSPGLDVHAAGADSTADGSFPLIWLLALALFGALAGIAFGAIYVVLQ